MWCGNLCCASLAVSPLTLSVAMANNMQQHNKWGGKAVGLAVSLEPPSAVP